MKQHKFKKSTYLPVALLIYFGYMTYPGRGYFYGGEYFYYFGIIAICLIVIVLLHFSLKRREKLRDEAKNDATEYGTYSDDNSGSTTN